MAMEINKPAGTDNSNNAKTVAEQVEEKKAANEAELNAEYIDERSITIVPIESGSLYRKVNNSVLGTKKNIIGSSVRSTQILSSNGGELKAYYPAIIGLDAANPEFMVRVKAWLSNMQLIVADNGTTLNTSFRYNHKSDYLKFKAEEDAINAARDAVPRGTTKAFKEAIKTWVTKINELESRKYQYGTPVNVVDWIMYRHCLLYPEVAKDIIFIGASQLTRFYIKDEVHEAERAKKVVEAKKRAMRNFVEIDSNDAKRNAVYLHVCKFRTENLSNALLRSNEEKSNIIMDFVNNHPEKFNKLVADKNIETKATIEVLILRGELVRSEHNQQISTPDGGFVGSNMNEAVAYFNNPNNAGQVEMLKNKLKLF